MGLRRGELRRSSVVGRLTMGPTPAGANTHTILTIVDDGGSALVTIAAGPGPVDDTDVLIAGSSVAAYNGVQHVTVTSPTTFEFVGYIADATGGTWTQQ